MRLYLFELKQHLKTYIYWMLGVLFLLLSGLQKFDGFSKTTTDIQAIFKQFPKVFLAVFGMINIDITQFAGFYAIIIYYVLICVCIYGVGLGYGAVTKETRLHTSEFLFTKPISKTKIIFTKLLVCFTYMFLFSFVTMMISILSAIPFEVKNIVELSFYFGIEIFLLGCYFILLSSFVSAIIKNIEKGYIITIYIYLAMFIIAILYDLFDMQLLRYVTPLKYFLVNQLIQGQFPLFFVVLLLTQMIIFFYFTITHFKQREWV